LGRRTPESIPHHVYRYRYRPLPPMTHHVSLMA
jgi:hypothetical protein